MNFDWKNIDLKNASIFDLTDDLELIKICIFDGNFIIDDKKEYLKNLDDKERFESMSEFAYRTKDVELEQVVGKTFPEELKKFQAICNE